MVAALFIYSKMITGKKKKLLTPEEILKRITPYDIFRYYMGSTKWELNEATYSPFREESNPSFLIGNRQGDLSFIDFADTDKRGDCFAFVQKLYSLPTFNDALRLIDKDFGLGISDSSNLGRYEKIVSSYKQPEQVKEKHYSVIQVVTRKFTNEELAYWNEYYQDIDDLRREHVYSIDKVFLNRKRFPLKDTELRFGYLYDDKWKIYRPFSEKRNKWTPNNVPITAMDGKDNILNCHTAFITKSKKDFLLIKKIFPCVCAVQNEGIGCFSKENVEYIKANSDRQILGFDSDVPGVRSSQQITKMYDFGYCNVPRSLLPEIKDFAEWGRVKGLKEIENYFVKKGLYD